MSTDNRISGELKDLLLTIENNHTNYERRYSLVLQAMGLAARRDYKLASVKIATRIPTTGWLL